MERSGSLRGRGCRCAEGATNAQNDMPMREKAIPVPSGSICELANAAQMRQIASRTAGPSAKIVGALVLLKRWQASLCEEAGRTGAAGCAGKRPFCKEAGRMVLAEGNEREWCLVRYLSSDENRVNLSQARCSYLVPLRP